MSAGKNPPAEAHSDREIISTRVVATSPEELFAAFRDPRRLTRWWGPHGFTSTFEEFDLRPAGKWRLVLHGPDGTDYPNEKEFIEVAPPHRIVMRHLDAVHGFLMTIAFTARGDGTHISWRMLFDSPGECARIRDLVVAANEQNLDRLESHLQSSLDPK